MADVTVSVVVTLTPSLVVGQTAQAVARIATDVNDSALDTKPVVWSSSATTVATVDANGLVKAVASGSAIIKATVGTVTGTAPLAVSAAVINIDAAEAALIEGTPLNGQLILRAPLKDYFLVKSVA